MLVRIKRKILIFRIASCYITYIEKEQSYGRLDCCIETPKYVYIFEFKLDGSAEAALRQIEDMGYADEFLASGKPIYKIGVNISSETGTVADWKVGNEYMPIPPYRALKTIQGTMFLYSG